ncbi:molybdate-anion transporter-like isoform X1 [Acropora muricata]|uniref:molybdate-anion transporter-like isoform X1 n=1 Tax=Acropora muricata TaxID=159855 RepID=UPI0034E569C8
MFLPSTCVLFFCAISFALYLFVANSRKQSSGGVEFRRFQRLYITVYLVAQGADWLQGPHVYALFSSYGMTSKQINQLFVVGFGSSMVFGTVVGSFADKIGRKMNCVLYGVLYGVDCLTKHIPNFWVLLCGRLAGGMATSILFSAFESWVICEHDKRGFSRQLLGDLFSNVSLGNSLVAIVAGFVAQTVASHFGFVAPFSLALLLLITGSAIICCWWPENYGDVRGNVKFSLVQGLDAIKNDSKVFCLGLIQSLFEGSMYTFVLEWTPALTPRSDLKREIVDEKIPHGWIFASFMFSVMLGSYTFKCLNKLDSVESLLRYVFGIATLSMIPPIIMPEKRAVIFVGFLVFEFCVGMFGPAMGFLRGKYVPESTRATIMNIFRVPLNFIVILLLVQDLSLSMVFTCCFVFLSVCCVMEHYLFRLSFKSVEISLITQKDGEEGSESVQI